MCLKPRTSMLLFLVFSGCVPMTQYPDEKTLDQVTDPQDSGDVINEADLDEDGYSSEDGDCDDEDPNISPEAVEICDNIDNDCDSLIDEEDDSLDPESAFIFSPDLDEDGFGANTTEIACSLPDQGVADNSLDCDDNDPLTNPEAEEFCDEQDNDCDGIIDNDLVQMRFNYDDFSFGVVVGLGVGARHNTADGVYDDLGINGIPDFISDIIYDGFGRIVDFIQDTDADGVADYREASSYDQYGNLIEFEIDSDGDGSFDSSETWSYDANGNLLRHGIDEDGNGVEESFEQYAYDAENNQTLQLKDTDGNGNTDFQREQFYTDGILTRIEWDVNLDGMIDYVASFEYSDNNDLLSYEIIQEGTNYTYETSTNTYSNGLIFSTSKTTDTNVDGSFDQSEYWEFNESELTVRYELDEGLDGTFEQNYRRSYDEYDHLIEYREDVDGDGMFELLSYYTFNQEGNILSYERDENADGTFEEQAEFFYTEQGALLERKNDYDDNATIDHNEVYVYDNNRNLTDLFIDSDADLNPDSAWQTTYTCASN